MWLMRGAATAAAKSGVLPLSAVGAILIGLIGLTEPDNTPPQPALPPAAPKAPAKLPSKLQLAEEAKIPVPSRWRTQSLGDVRSGDRYCRYYPPFTVRYCPLLSVTARYGPLLSVTTRRCARTSST